MDSGDDSGMMGVSVVFSAMVSVAGSVVGSDTVVSVALSDGAFSWVVSVPASAMGSLSPQRQAA